MHDDIRRFELTGTITSDTFMSARESLIREMESGMRDDGFIPVLDLTPQFTREFDAETETFSFKLSIYGTYVGEETSWQVAGLMNGLPVEKYTPHEKSKPS